MLILTFGFAISYDRRSIVRRNWPAKTHPHSTSSDKLLSKATSKCDAQCGHLYNLFSTKNSSVAINL